MDIFDKSFAMAAIETTIHKGFLAVTAIVLLADVSAAHAATVTSPASLAGGIIVDFESFALGTIGPIVTSGMAISATPASAPVASSLAYAQYPGIVSGNIFGFNADVSFSIVFDKPVAIFGMGVLDPNFLGNRLSAYDVSGNVLDFTDSGTLDFPVGPTGGSLSSYVGFSYGSPVIKRIELVGAPGDLLGIDNIGYLSPASVPGPLPALGMAAAFGFSRKLRRRIKVSHKTVSSPHVS
jgi:hypothetical protein